LVTLTLVTSYFNRPVHLRSCYPIITTLSLKVILPHWLSVGNNQLVYKHLKIWANNFLMQSTQQCDVFICDLVHVIKIYQGQLYCLYNDGSTSLFNDELWVFKGLLDCNHDHINMQWVVNLNNSNEQFAFIVNGKKLWTMHNNPL
jgi:hypothetical protein